MDLEQININKEARYSSIRNKYQSLSVDELRILVKKMYNGEPKNPTWAALGMYTEREIVLHEYNYKSGIYKIANDLYLKHIHRELDEQDYNNQFIQD